MARHELEKDIQKSIIDYLEVIGVFVYKNSTVGIYKKATDSYIPAQTKGVADLTAIRDGQVYQIEVKTKTGRQSDHQKEFQENWESAGGIYILGGMDEVMAVIK